MNRKRSQKPPVNRKMTAAWLVCMGIFIVELFFYTWCRVQYTHAGYDISRINATHQEMVTLQNNLKIEIERLKSPDRIVEIAKTRIGLVSPAPEQMVTIQ